MDKQGQTLLDIMKDKLNHQAPTRLSGNMRPGASTAM